MGIGHNKEEIFTFSNKIGKLFIQFLANKLF